MPSVECRDGPLEGPQLGAHAAIAHRGRAAQDRRRYCCPPRTEQSTRPRHSGHSQEAGWLAIHPAWLSLAPTGSLTAKVPSGADWAYDRLIVRWDGPTVRLFTRRGYDWTDRYPAIAGAAAKLRVRSFTLDGEAVVCGADGVAVFDALHRRRRANDAILFALRPDRQRRGFPSAAAWEAQSPAGPAARPARRQGSNSTSTPTPTAPPSSGKPARWAWRGSCRSG
jgi:hypothetical protein